MNLTSITALLALAKAAIELGHEYASVAPQLANGAGRLAEDGKAAGAALGALIGDIKNGRYSETPQDVGDVLDRFGVIAGEAAALVGPAAAIVSKAATLPSVAAIKSLATA